MKTLNKKEEDKTKEGNRKSEGNKNEETMKERNEEIFNLEDRKCGSNDEVKEPGQMRRGKMWKEKFK